MICHPCILTVRYLCWLIRCPKLCFNLFRDWVVVYFGLQVKTVKSSSRRLLSSTHFFKKNTPLQLSRKVIFLQYFIFNPPPSPSSASLHTKDLLIPFLQIKFQCFQFQCLHITRKTLIFIGPPPSFDMLYKTLKLQPHFLKLKILTSNTSHPTIQHQRKVIRQ